MPRDFPYHWRYRVRGTVLAKRSFLRTRADIVACVRVDFARKRIGLNNIISDGDIADPMCAAFIASARAVVVHVPRSEGFGSSRRSQKEEQFGSLTFSGTKQNMRH